jgi:3-phenylpropionate/trans-cinnamate dioxygenase ferredoxin subunit
MSESYHDICSLEELEVGATRAAIVAGWPVLLSRTSQGVHALINRCTHADASLDGGRVRMGAITCPLHGAKFQLATGACVGGAYPPLLTFSVRMNDDRVQVAVPDSPPGPEHRPVEI